jgi:hypothetical protein
MKRLGLGLLGCGLVLISIAVLLVIFVFGAINMAVGLLD